MSYEVLINLQWAFIMLLLQAINRVGASFSQQQKTWERRGLASLQYFFFLQLSAFYIPKHGSERRRRSKPGMSPQDHSLSFLAWQEVSAVMYIWLHHKSLKSLRRENPANAFISLSEIRYYTCQMLLRISFLFFFFLSAMKIVVFSQFPL